MGGEVAGCRSGEEEIAGCRNGEGRLLDVGVGRRRLLDVAVGRRGVGVGRRETQLMTPGTSLFNYILATGDKCDRFPVVCPLCYLKNWTGKSW